MFFVILGTLGISFAEQKNSFSDRSPADEFGGPQKGEIAPNALLTRLDGREVELSEYIGKLPVVLELGSYTYPIFRQKHKGMEALYAKYGNEATFFVIYVIEAHPHGDICPYTGQEWVTQENKNQGILYSQPVNHAQRLELAKKAQADLGIRIPILIDDMDNSTWRAYGRAPNAAYLIGIDGRIRVRQGWLDPAGLKQALEYELLTTNNK